MQDVRDKFATMWLGPGKYYVGPVGAVSQ